MSKFKIGDRVMVYGAVQIGDQSYKARPGGKATIIYYPNSEPYVQFDDDRDTHYSVDPKQCRRLVKKPRRRIWIKTIVKNEYYKGTQYICSSFKTDDSFVEFVEVLKKK